MPILFLARVSSALMPQLYTVPLLLLLTCFVADALKFTFNRFDGEDILLREGALFDSRTIVLTGKTGLLNGTALYASPLHTKGKWSFNTTFVFRMVPNGPSGGVHLLAFLIAPSYMSLYPVLSNEDLESLKDGRSPSFLLPFLLAFDDDGVFMSINGSSGSEESAGYWIGEQFQKLKPNTGQNIQVWVDYHNHQNQLNVTITSAGNRKPNRPLISLHSVNLSTILRDEMYASFLSFTVGPFVQEHHMCAWSFSTRGSAPPLDLSQLPSFMPEKSIYRSARFVAGVTVGSLIVLLIPIAAVFLRKLKSKELVEEWELGYWPHRFSYKELSIATKGFGDDELLGSGGFGRVYRGVIPSGGLQVAVKCIKREVTEGMSEFIAEISSIGRLQHRNLAQLRGWCRKDKQLFLVYDYMPNGSLDKMIFGSPKTVLGWSQMYRILQGVAAALLYLHEQWEKTVVHRDIKSSNVLLDSELNARLGDFGLARLYDHAQNPQTSRVVGMLGYIPPEIVNTGKATPSSDVFSFGVVLLEVACGRRPVELFRDSEQVILVDWIWDLYGKQKLMDAVDPNFGGEFDEEEMQRVLQLGLLCCQGKPQSRPTKRQVLQMLESEIPLPHLRMPSPNTSISIALSDTSSYP